MLQILKLMKKAILTATILLFSIYILPAQDLELGLPDTLRSCRADSILLQAGNGFTGYLWNTGDTIPFIFVKENGLYILEGNSGDTLTVIDSTFVIIVQAEIKQSDTSIHCGDTIQLFPDTDGFIYLWEPGMEISDTITVFPKNSEQYFLTITDPLTLWNYCRDSVRITVDPLITIDSINQLKMGCPGENKAQIQVIVSGDYEPFLYEWSDGFPLQEDSSIVIGLTDGDIELEITDSIGCKLSETIEVKAYPFPELDLITDPGDTVYIQRPTVNFRYENISYDSLNVDTFRITSWTWNFGDGSNSPLATPSYAYKNTGTYNVVFDYTTFFGCKGTDSLTVIVKPVKLKIPNVFTPNNDGSNDKFVIEIDENFNGETSYKYSSGSSEKYISDYYLSSELIIFNRWGKIIYEDSDYKNDWDAKNTPDGPYFFILKCKGQYSDDVYKGAVHILGSGLSE